jgi:hypothetical protein
VTAETLLVAALDDLSVRREEVGRSLVVALVERRAPGSSTLSGVEDAPPQPASANAAAAPIASKKRTPPRL